MKQNHKKNFLMGMRDGIPIALGYFAVSIALGIEASKSGMTAFQATLTSFLINASAGEFIGFTLIAQKAGVLEIILMEAVANARYLLMSCSLSQKLDTKTSFLKRVLLGYNVTDEIFGISIAVEGKLDPFYNYGADAVAIPGWSLGTLFGAILGTILPQNIISALSVALYGMFVAIFIPPARENKIILALVIISFVSSFVFSKISLFSVIPEGIKIIILTVLISLTAAILFPVPKGEDHE